jgi:hypothetical protein
MGHAATTTLGPRIRLAILSISDIEAHAAFLEENGVTSELTEPGLPADVMDLAQRMANAEGEPMYVLGCREDISARHPCDSTIHGKRPGTKRS